MASYASMLILRNADLYTPAHIGLRDVLVIDERVAHIAEPGLKVGSLPVAEYDADGRAVTPGFIDNHVHVLGGGGGLGFHSRAPELQTSQLTRVGTTSVIGMIGYDQSTKDMRALVGKTKAFNNDGISAYALSGATLRHPVPTLTGDICNDIAFVDEIIGVGELSISELGYGYDSLGPGAQYVAETLVQALLVGRLAGKGGVLCLQVPPYFGACLKPLFDMLDRSGLPISQMVPSHVNQTDRYMEDAATWGRRGGWVDVGANYRPDNNYERSTDPAAAVTKLIEVGVPSERILISSDGNGAPPKEEKGEATPTRANYMPVSSLLMVWQQLIADERVSAEQALAFVTSNVAAAYKLPGKGVVQEGADADLVVFDEKWQVDTVFARGRTMIEDGAVVVRSMFEETIIASLS